MLRGARFGVALVLGCTVSGPAVADVWDTAATSPDNSSMSTRNELVHGSSQVHDLGVRPGPAADQDFFFVGQKKYSSYEAIVDGVTGGVVDDNYDDNYKFDRIANDGTTVLQACSAVTPGMGLGGYLAWQNNTASDVVTERLRVSSPACGTTCTSSDQYTIRFYETTYSIPRFNNSGTQTTILMIQNTSEVTVNVAVHFWSATGTHLGASTAAIAGHGMLLLNTSSLAYAAGVSGTVTVSNDGRYGDLSGKAVALEPSTGFTFDTPMLARPI